MRDRLSWERVWLLARGGRRIWFAHAPGKGRQKGVGRKAYLQKADGKTGVSAQKKPPESSLGEGGKAIPHAERRNPAATAEGATTTCLGPKRQRQEGTSLIVDPKSPPKRSSHRRWPPHGDFQKKKTLWKRTQLQTQEETIPPRERRTSFRQRENEPP